MTKYKRLWRATYIGLFLWVVNVVVGLFVVFMIPEHWVLADPSKYGLLVHHFVPIIGCNLVSTVAVIFLIRTVLEKQHEIDTLTSSK